MWRRSWHEERTSALLMIWHLFLINRSSLSSAMSNGKDKTQSLILRILFWNPSFGFSKWPNPIITTFFRGTWILCFILSLKSVCKWCDGINLWTSWSGTAADLQCDSMWQSQNTKIVAIATVFSAVNCRRKCNVSCLNWKRIIVKLSLETARIFWHCKNIQITPGS